ncbi:MAG: TRAP transporter large permease [Roseibium album]|uniref:TRAP transporter large permease protein n=1 Tax=Roseibium album TaxID=311410 RepID=A0A0M7AYI9_9HYPH|nr:TRAP transporter large permease [Roseibium album]MBG6144541.1 tripartite ATP-independent transporter DctM subunit [Labrenzia sp. EL_142]MBG6154302.1 tripartite ATP-independent transporter DctM subunit [Labrenzia sp. EL_162]MBG6161586.1 tripartite ATP-independent transporter DctM subunit [Labrenzia sp. EL_195]MBG6175171.1 tripartite ATP-independent transporter DctM subunit [Labrenzia sp. EL_132]MBG6193569.1 tripartite ATP-independent transporter DctM subunit [Labrenzia sp. EL_159]MBG6199939
MEVFVLFAVFVGSLVIGIPVAIALGLSSLSYLLVSGIPLVVIPQKVYAGIDVFVLLSIPGFILAGNLMNNGGITERIIRFANALVGWVRGGLGLTNIGASMLFGGITGTAVADAASIGGVMIPGMKKAGYPADFSAAVTAASSTVGPIIPPSVPMIIVGALSGISVGQMFMAGAVPGLLMGLAMMITCYVIARRKNFPREPWRGASELVRALGSAFWAIAMTGIIIYGLLSGIATPTETAVVASVYAFIVGAFVYRELPLKKVPKIIVDSAVSAASILALVGLANVFGWILVSERIPQAIASAVLTITDNPILVILIINLLLLFVGMFMETIAALIILFVPLLSLAQAVGIEPLHFATFAVLNLMIGLTTPPVGVCLFVCAGIARLPLTPVVKAILPFLLSNIIVLLLVSFIPALATWLPNLIFQ